MRQFELHRAYRGKDIVSQVLQLDQGIHISLYGGDISHIGAIGMIDPIGARSVIQFPGHREKTICETWINALFATGLYPAVVEAGIHYDGLDMSGIEDILALADELMDETLAFLIRQTHSHRCF